jgi:hypothetical protein
MQSTARPNYYKILGIPRTASQKEVTRAYRRLAQKFHPDLHAPEQKPWAEERMKQINMAYAVLEDPESRAHYDATLGLQFDAPPSQRGSTSPPPKDWSTIFSSYQASQQTPLSKWQKQIALAKFALWTFILGFLMTGIYLIFVQWQLVTKFFPLTLDKLIWLAENDIHRQLIFALIWWVVFIVSLFRIVPSRR